MTRLNNVSGAPGLAPCYCVYCTQAVADGHQSQCAGVALLPTQHRSGLSHESRGAQNGISMHVDSLSMIICAKNQTQPL